MEEKTAFGRGLRQLRLIRGLPQEAFTPTLSLAYASVVERGVKLIALDRIAGLATVLDVHPLTLLTAMYVEKDGQGVDELLAHVRRDFAHLAKQTPRGSVGKDSRNRAEAIANALQWLEQQAKVTVKRAAAQRKRATNSASEEHKGAIVPSN